MPPRGEAAVAAKAAAADVSRFRYEDAFSRNLGWVTAGEQQILRGKRAAIAGLGGVGGSHLLTLTRLGIGAFNIADFDVFELANFNRQAGAMVSTLGQPKAETLARMARDINPTLDLEIFPRGIDEANLDAFLAGVDVYVDSLDFFVLDLRRKLFQRCSELGIPAVIAGPIGMGTGYLVFLPGKFSFEQYFRLAGLPPERQRVNFALGLTPRGFQRAYLMDASRIDLNGERGPSTSLSCELCAGVAAAEVLKLLLKRGRVRAAPCYHQFDAYTGRWTRGWLPGGNRNPWQRLKLAVAYRLSEQLSRDALPRPHAAKSDIEAILDAARWAPSGDNIQPWRFEIHDDQRLTIHIEASGDVYDYHDGEPTLFAAGALLESLRIAASAYRRRLHWRYLERSGTSHRIAVELPVAEDVTADALFPFLPIRSVDRKAHRRVPLDPERKAALVAALGNKLTIQWHESLGERWRAAAINARGTDIRLRLREAFDIHRRILDWQRNFSPTGIPGTAIGLDPLARRLTRWLLQDWRRTAAMNRWSGTGLARLEMDVIPGLFCGAHFTLHPLAPPAPEDRPKFLLETGQAVQRFWLTATRLGLVLQPSLAPLCFAYYGRAGVPFTSDPHLLRKARRLAESVEAFADRNGNPPIFMGRVGYPTSSRIRARSIRRGLDELLSRGAA